VSFFLTCHRRRPVFVEVKSRVGVASKVQKRVRTEVMAAGAEWWTARSARAAFDGVASLGVVFRRPWKSPELRAWEGPFTEPDEAAAASPGGGGSSTGPPPASVGGAGCRDAIRSCTKSGRYPGVFGAPRQKSLWSPVIIERARARKRKEAFQGGVLSERCRDASVAVQRNETCRHAFSTSS
jgi:hypothetical protein